jgi:hypothetical protein
MRRPPITAFHVLLAGAFWLTLLVTLGGCSLEPSGEIATADSPLIQATCTKVAGDKWARYPWEASFPVNGQHIFCQHHVAETSPSTWPAGMSGCSGQPGLYQVDVWVREAGSNPNYRCTRVQVPTPAISHWNFVETLELGWLTSGQGTAATRHIEGIEMGPGTTAIMSRLQDVYQTGCIPGTACVSAVNVKTNPPAWVWVDTMLIATSFQFWVTAL